MLVFEFDKFKNQCFYKMDIPWPSLNDKVSTSKKEVATVVSNLLVKT